MSRSRPRAKTAAPLEAEARAYRAGKKSGARAPAPDAPGSASREALEAAANPAAAERAAAFVLVAIAALALARAITPFTPGMWLWSLNLQRFVAPAWAWGTWALLALALVPAVARRALPALERSGEWMRLHSVAAGMAGAAFAAALALAFPDQLRFTGDFLIRQGTVEVAAVPPSRVWPQAMPLDALLHYSLPLWATRAGLADANGAARVIGAAEAALLGALAVAFAATLRLRGAAMWTGAALVLGGFLGLFTGYGKAFTETTVLAAAIGVAGLTVIREGRGLLAMSLAFALALAIHRSSLAFLPGVVLAWVLWARRFGTWSSWGARLGLGVTALALAVLLPRIVHVVTTIDPVHFASREVAARGGLWASALDPVRLLDAGNVLMLLAPLTLVAIAALLGFAGKLPRGREALFLAVLAVPFAVSIPFVHALGGLFRDVDDFAAAGMLCTLLAAWLAGEILRAAPSRRWIALPLLLAAFVPTLQWLVHQTDVERGVHRVEALMKEPPPRTDAERARTWDFVGSRWNQLERFDASAEAMAQSVKYGPSPRMLHQLAIAEDLRGNLRGSLDVYRRLVAEDTNNVAAWGGYANVAGRLGDRAELRRAVSRLVAINPADEQARRILSVLDSTAALR